MINNRNKINLLTATSVALLMTACGGGSNPVADDGKFKQPDVYAGFPVTLAGHPDKTTSVSYSGQMARHVLRESVKATLDGPTTMGYATIVEVNTYLKNAEDNGAYPADDLPIKAPSDNGVFAFKEVLNNELGTKKNLYGKMYNSEKNGDPISGADASKTMGVPSVGGTGLTAKETVDLWVGYFGADQAGHGDGTADHHDMTNGYDYKQLIPKYLMGAVFYSESVNHYLDENLEPGTKDNDSGYKETSHYTGKEHSWDEGFGYFGAAANYGMLSAADNYKVAKKGSKSSDPAGALALADVDADTKVSLYTEYTSGPAYYAASFDKDGKSTYGKDSMDAWLEGRTIIANAVDADKVARKLTDAERDQLKELAKTIAINWELVFAEAVFKYAGESIEQIEKLEAGTTTSPKKYYSVWSEMKGFMLSLQYGGALSKIDKTNFEDIDNLIGYGPVMQDGKQVNGLAQGTHSKSFTLSDASTTAFSDYKAKLKSVQAKLDAFYGLKAKQHDHR